MRTFGNAAPRYMEFRVEGDDAVYRLPLAGSLKAEYNMRLFKSSREKDATEREYQSQQLMLDMFADYLGEEFVSRMTTAMMLDIWKAWMEESAGANQEPGE